MSEYSLTTFAAEMGRRDLFALGLVLLAFCLLAAGCRERTVEAAPPVSVKVKAAETTTTAGGIHYSATIKPETQVELAFRISGYVDRLLQVRGVDGALRDVQEGDFVKQGTALARLRQSDYAVKVQQSQSQVSEARSGLDSNKAQHAEALSSLESSKAQLAESEASLEKARQDFERAKNLFASQSLTKPEYDAAKAQYDVALATRDASRSRVAMSEAKVSAAEAQVGMTQAKIKGSQAMVAEAMIPLQDTSLRAPMHALILQKSVEVGTLVSPGKVGFLIADITRVKAAFGVPDVMLAKLKLGDTLTVTTEALADRTFSGQITRISPMADSQSRVFEVEVTIPNGDGALQIGMIAGLEVMTGAAAPPSTVVPLSAIIRAKGQEEQYAVFVVDEKGGQAIARMRPVRLGEALGNTIAILEGIQAGERIITTGTTLVQDGQSVQIIP